MTSEQAGWSGRYYEDFEVGDVYRHPLGRTVTETDNTWFTLLTMNTAQIHFNAEVGKQSEFGRCLVASTFTLAVVAGLSVIDTSFNAVANLEWKTIQLPNPVFAGDTIWAESMVLAKRESKSRPHAGIVTIKTRGLNQDGVDVLVYERSFMVHKKSAAMSYFPEPKVPMVGPAEGGGDAATG